MPAPRNDYEIVVPEDEPQAVDNEQTELVSVPDQADVDQLKQEQQKALSMFIWNYVSKKL